MSRRRRGERGASAVEFTLVFMLLCVLIFGLIEVCWLVFDELGVSRMAKDGARAAAASGSAPDADYNVLQAIKEASNLDTKKILGITVFYVPNASSPDTAVSDIGAGSACWSQPTKAPHTNSIGVDDVCNVYNFLDLDKDSDKFGCIGTDGITQLIDNKLCPKTTIDASDCSPLPSPKAIVQGSSPARKSGRCDIAGYDSMNGTAAETAVIGVRVQYEHSGVTGFFKQFSGTFTITQTSYARVEPARYDNS